MRGKHGGLRVSLDKATIMFPTEFYAQASEKAEKVRTARDEDEAVPGGGGTSSGGARCRWARRKVACPINEDATFGDCDCEIDFFDRALINGAVRPVRAP